MGLDNQLIPNETACQLRKSKIYSVYSLLDCNENRLPANLEIPVLKQKLLDSGPKETSLFDVPFPKIFRTGIVGLDKLQDLVPGKVYEFCGHSATGKTQICNTIAVNLAEKYLCEVFYVNTRDNFSSARVHSILMAKGFEKSKIEKIMKLVKVEQADSVDDLLELLNYILYNRQKHPKLRLLVIDDLPALFFLFLGNKSYHNIKLLMTVQTLLLRLALEHELVVITVNVLTSQSDQSKTDITPALSKYWTPTVRFMMENQVNCKVLVVMKSPTIEESTHAHVRITNAGVI